MGATEAKNARYHANFPVISLLNREAGVETGSLETGSPATFADTPPRQIGTGAKQRGAAKSIAPRDGQN